MIRLTCSIVALPLLVLVIVSVDAQESLLKPVSKEQPDVNLFEPKGAGRDYPPANTAISGVKQTNKFWANWAVETTDPNDADGSTLAIYVMPYSLKWIPGNQSSVAELALSHNPEGEIFEYDNGITVGSDHIQKYYTPFAHELSLGAVDALSERHTIVKESLFGCHIEVRGPVGNETSRKITYPIFQGMAYVSGLYEGDITPKIGSDEPLQEVSRVADGIWKFVNARSKEFRVYAVTRNGDLDGTHSFDAQGTMTTNFEGWLRIARVLQGSDRAVLDAHAGSVLVDWTMDVQEGGKVEYTFDALGASELNFLHFAYPHHVELLTNEKAAISLMKAPTKGNMTALLGKTWSMDVDIQAAEALGWLPSGEAFDQDRKAEILRAAQEDLANWEQDGNWQKELLQDTYYFSGKGFQKLSSVCLILEELAGADSEATTRCTDILAEAFGCMYDWDTTNPNCASKPNGSYYDELWGGIPAKNGFFRPEGQTPCWDHDFGNACYNDHHYHYGYFVTSGAVLVKLRPALLENVDFVDWVHTLIRDTANPSSEDIWFPTFRCFDWFDFHSWSRGVMPSDVGKDQESTSEEVNLLYGLVLWGQVTNVTSLKSLGATMLALETMAIKSYFLMKTGNPNHHPDFVKNHVTGIFFQNLVRYDTWFGSEPEKMHGIQMLPLSAALQMTRDAEFCQQEWEDVLTDVVLDGGLSNPWTSVLNTGNLAMWRREDAWTSLTNPALALDDGLTRSFGLYWIAKQQPQVLPTWPPPTTQAPTQPPTSSPWGTYGIVAVVVIVVAVGGYAFFNQQDAQKRSEHEVQLETELQS